MTTEAAGSLWDQLDRRVSPIDSRPRLAEGIEKVRQHLRDGTEYWILKAPRKGSYVKVDEHDHALMGLMDGERTLKEIAIADYEKRGTLSFAKIADLADLLGRKGFLARAHVDAWGGLESRLPRRRVDAVTTTALHLLREGEVTSSRVDPLFAAIYRYGGRYLFTRTGAVLLSLFAAAGITAFVTELVRGRYDILLGGDSLLTGLVLFVALNLVELAIHESGHGVAVKHAGRTVHQAGFMLYFGLPVAFVDTTDVWLAPRGKRIINSLAGPATDLLIGATCAILAVAVPESDAGAFFFAWSFVGVFKALVNLCPLVELDGYYLLVDLTERPMLRARSLAFVRGPFWRKLMARERLDGDERLFALFGLGSILGTLGIIAFAALTWQLRLWPLFREAWESGRVPERVAVIAAAAVALAFALVIFAGLGRKLWRSAVHGFHWARRTTNEARHRRTIAALKRAPTWSQLPPAALVEVARSLRQERIGAGEHVVTQGEPGDRFFVIDEGTFEVLVDGKAVSSIGPGNYFGERSLLDDAPRAATVLAQTDGVVLALDRPTFDRLVANDVSIRRRIASFVDIREELQRQPLFAELSPGEFDVLLARLETRTASAGETIIREGEEADAFFIVRNGEFAVSRGAERLNLLGPGDVFGEIALTRGGTRTATVAAVTDGELLTLDERSFSEVLVAYCDRGAEVQRLTRYRMEGHHAFSAAAG